MKKLNVTQENHTYTRKPKVTITQYKHTYTHT